ncbi:unnamed protein product, partial [Closterium sp. Yama58-4]
GFAKGLADVADNLSRAAASVSLPPHPASPDSGQGKGGEGAGGRDPEALLKSLLDGVEMTEKQLLQVFRQHGMERHDPMGQRFDPNLHNAVFELHDPSKEPGTIAHVLKVGYTLHGRVSLHARPWRVDVAEEEVQYARLLPPLLAPLHPLLLAPLSPALICAHCVLLLRRPACPSIPFSPSLRAFTFSCNAVARLFLPCTLITCTLITCTLITCTLITCTLITCTLITCTLITCTLITCTLITCILITCTLITCTLITCTLITCTLIACTLITCTLITCTLITCTLITCTLITCILITCTLITCTLITCTLITCTLITCRAATCRAATCRVDTCRVDTCLVATWCHVAGRIGGLHHHRYPLSLRRAPEQVARMAAADLVGVVREEVGRVGGQVEAVQALQRASAQAGGDRGAALEARAREAEEKAAQLNDTVGRLQAALRQHSATIAALQVGNTVVPMQVGNTVVPMQVGNTVVPMQVGNTVVPMQVGNTVVPMQVGNTVVPMQVGNTVVPMGGFFQNVAAEQAAAGAAGKEGGRPLGRTVVEEDHPGRWRQHTFHRTGAYGFIQYSAYRLTAARIAVVGMGALGLRSKRRVEGCWWHRLDGHTVVAGKLTQMVMEEHHNYLYELVVLQCALEEEVAETGGHLRIFLDRQVLFPFREDTKEKIDNGTGPMAYHVAYCGPPMHMEMEQRSVHQFIHYHRYAAGYDHFRLYDATAVTPALTAALQPLMDDGLLSIADFREAYQFDSWYFSQAVAMHDCMYGMRQRAHWIAFHDLDEYLALPPPASLPALLQRYTELPYITLGMYVFSAHLCEDGPDDVWSDDEKRFAVERMVQRRAAPYCLREEEDPKLCIDYYGHRKMFLNPRKVEAVYVHRVDKPATGGVDLSVDDMYFAHLRSLNGKGVACRPPTDKENDIPAAELERCTTVADTAARARECAQEGFTNQFLCKPRATR